MLSQIPFDLPFSSFEDIANGDIVRYGAILKDAETGRIVGHLQESGIAQSLLSQDNFFSNIATVVHFVDHKHRVKHLYRRPSPPVEGNDGDAAGTASGDFRRVADDRRWRERCRIPLRQATQQSRQSRQRRSMP
ncbi:MAG: hypothetical protein U1F21_04265 [Sphaerotilus natans]